jgi:hypothetical protein
MFWTPSACISLSCWSICALVCPYRGDAATPTVLGETVISATC